MIMKRANIASVYGVSVHVYILPPIPEFAKGSYIYIYTSLRQHIYIYMYLVYQMCTTFLISQHQLYIYSIKAN